MATATRKPKAPSIFLAELTRDLTLGEVGTDPEAPIRAAYGEFRDRVVIRKGQVVDVAREAATGRWIVALRLPAGRVLTLSTEAAKGLLSACRWHDGRVMAAGIDGEMAIGLYENARIRARAEGRTLSGRIDTRS